MNKSCLSIVIATYNSGKKLELVLDSIRKQNNQQIIKEIILVDGGSTDGTLSIADKYRCVVIANPRVEPVYAKFIGLKEARGRYVMFLDHDEVLENNTSISKKVRLINKKNVAGVMSSGYLNPKGYPFINDYINELGDPFTYFVYRFSKSKDNFVSWIKKRYFLVGEDLNGLVVNFSKSCDLPLIELVAGGGMIDKGILSKMSPEVFSDPRLIPHLFYLFVSKGYYIGVTKEDLLIHYSADTFSKYLTKIRWRIINNVFFLDSMAQSGYSGREKYLSNWKKVKKYIFIPYSFSLILPTIDSFFLAIKNKNLNYLIHVILTIYTALSIVYFYTQKIIGFRPKLKSYDGSKEINFNGFNSKK